MKFKGVKLEGIKGSFELLPVTISNCENTTTETTIISATVPAGTWKDGEAITIHCKRSFRQETGGSVNVISKWKANNTLARNSTVSVPNFTNPVMALAVFKFIRRGSGILMPKDGDLAGSVGVMQYNTQDLYGNNNVPDYYYDRTTTTFITTNINFNNAIVLSNSITFGTASTNLYLQISDAVCKKEAG